MPATPPNKLAGTRHNKLWKKLRAPPKPPWPPPPPPACSRWPPPPPPQPNRPPPISPWPPLPPKPPWACPKMPSVSKTWAKKDLLNPATANKDKARPPPKTKTHPKNPVQKPATRPACKQVKIMACPLNWPNSACPPTTGRACAASSPQGQTERAKAVKSPPNTANSSKVTSARSQPAPPPTPANHTAPSPIPRPSQ